MFIFMDQKLPAFCGGPLYTALYLEKYTVSILFFHQENIFLSQKRGDNCECCPVWLSS